MYLVTQAVVPAMHLAAAANPYAPPKIDTGDTAWLLASSALVLLMTPGLAFFYAGMVRSKNVLGMLMQNYVAMGIVSVLWVLFTFSLAFDKGSGASGNAFIGSFHFAGLMHQNSGVPGYSLDDPALRVRRVPADVRDHHAGADRRLHGRPLAVQRVRGLRGDLDRSSTTPSSRTGCSTRTAGCSAGGPRTSPAARSSTRTRAPPASRCASCSASARAGRSRR